jgi:hypothetical protein
MLTQKVIFVLLCVALIDPIRTNPTCDTAWHKNHCSCKQAFYCTLKSYYIIKLKICLWLIFVQRKMNLRPKRPFFQPPPPKFLQKSFKKALKNVFLETNKLNRLTKCPCTKPKSKLTQSSINRTCRCKLWACFEILLF